ncbi:MAG: CoA-binding protein, partial [Promethearchaeota archaeon]
ALPPHVVPQIFRECGEKGVKRIILISGGFREMTDDRKNTLTEEIKEIAEQYGISFIGPNCLGVYNNWIYPEDASRAFNTAIWEKVKRGTFSIASQSGTLASHIWFDPDNIDIGLSKSISVGNEADIDIVDCLEYFKDDEQTEVIGLYIEEVKRGKKFLEIARELTVKKPIIAIFGGGSQAGKRAIQSHTGALAGNPKTYSAVFKQVGIIQTGLVEEFLDLALALSRKIIPKGKRLGIVTNSGGPSCMIADHAEKLGLTIPEFSSSLQEKLKTIIPKTGSTKNPLDFTFDMNLYNYYVVIPKLLMKSGEIDAIIMYGVFGFQDVLNKLLKNERIAKHADFPAIKEKKQPPLEKVLIEPLLKASRKYSIPVFLINPQNYSSPWSKKIRETGGILFQLWDRPVRCLAKLCEYGLFLNKKKKRKEFN